MKRILVCVMAAVTLAGCGSGESNERPTPTPFNQTEFNKNFRAAMAQVPTHFEHARGEKIGTSGKVEIFKSTIVLPGAEECLVNSTHDDAAALVCGYERTDSLADAKTGYAELKKRAIAAAPHDSDVQEQRNQPGFPARYIIQSHDVQAIVSLAEMDGAKKYGVALTFVRPSD